MIYNYIPDRLAQIILFGFLLIFMPVLAAAGNWQTQALVQPGSGAMPLLPYLDYYIDKTCSMDIEEAAAPGMANSYQPLALDKLPRVEGHTWLRFTISPLLPDTRPATFLLDMGQSLPGAPILYDPERNELSGALEWHENFPTQRNILLLPEEGSQAITCYIRLSGLPGPWFSPVIRTPQNAASNLLGLSRTGAILALAVVMILCLLRGMSENGQWRVWTALFVAAALAQALLGMPVMEQKLNISTLAATLLPGIALMLLPHVGRHLLATPLHSRNLDIQLILLSLPGAALALWPLFPGWHWLDRWLELWPAGAIIFIPTALGAWISGLAGARRFLLCCLILPIFVAVAYYGLDFGFPPNFLSSIPLWGVALSALLLATARSPLYAEKKTQAKKSQRPAKQEITIPQLDNDTVINLDHPLDDPHLRLVNMQDENSQELNHASPMREQTADLSMEPVVSTPNAHMDARENALREPLDEILRQGAAMGDCSLPPAVRQYAENMITAANTMARIMSGENTPDTDNVQLPAPARENETFNLQHLLRNVHNSIAPAAESAGTALSWYMPPHLCRLYRGRPAELENSLRMLLESAVRASKNGSVHLSARHVPESADKGHIIFSITDNGTGVPPIDRSTLAITKTWEMIGKCGGYLAMEAAPDGVSIVLSMRFIPVDEEERDDTDSTPNIILACEDAAKRRGLRQTLENLPCRVSEAATIHEVLMCQAANPAVLLIAYGNMARPAASDMTRKFHELALNSGIRQCALLAVTMDDSQWELLKPSGFTHAMLDQENPEILENTVRDLLATLVPPVQNNCNDNPDNNEPHVETSLDSNIQPMEEATGKTASNTEPEPIPSPVPVTAAEIPAPEHISSPQPDATRHEVAAKNRQPSQPLQVFEGPDWLDQIPPDLPEDTSDNGQSTPVNNALKNGNITAKHENIVPMTDLPPDFEEFVGEPVPVADIIPAAAKVEEAAPKLPDDESINPAPESRQAEEVAVDNVMLPLPTGASAEKTETAKETKHSSFMDFIIGVGRKVSKNNIFSQSKNDIPESAQPDISNLDHEKKEESIPLTYNVPTDNMPMPPSSETTAQETGSSETLLDSVSHDHGNPEPPEDNSKNDPLIAALITQLNAAMQSAEKAYASKDCATVALATKRIAIQAEGVGLRSLSRMANCVERAAAHSDIQAISDLLPELGLAVERTRIALGYKKTN